MISLAVKVDISTAKPDEIDTVLGILDEAAAWIITNNLPSVWKPGEFSHQTFLDQIAQDEVYLASVDGIAVGTFVLQWSDSFWWGERSSEAGYFHKFAVRPLLAGRGIGLEMLRWAEQRTRSAGKKFFGSTVILTGLYDPLTMFFETRRRMISDEPSPMVLRRASLQ